MNLIDYNSKLNDHFDSIKNTLTIMAKKAYKVDSDLDINNYRMGESVGQRNDRLLLKDPVFMSQYSSLNSNEIESFFEKVLKPLTQKY